MVKLGESTTPPQADGDSDKDFYLKAVASVTLDPTSRGLDPILTYDGFAGEKTSHGVSKLALREGVATTFSASKRYLGETSF